MYPFIVNERVLLRLRNHKLKAKSIWWLQEIASKIEASNISYVNINDLIFT